jgi:quercetin dioxygenase-like cupin family protein
MRKTASLVLSFTAALGTAQALPAKPEAKKDTKPGPAIKVPPLPPQLDDTLFADVAKAEWSPVRSLPKGAMGALVGTDPNNGGMAGWLKLPAGYRIPSSWESHLSTYTVISGQLTITSNGDKHPLGPGSYVVLTMRDKHEIVCGAASECLLLVQHLGPADMHWVNPADAPKAR